MDGQYLRGCEPAQATLCYHSWNFTWLGCIRVDMMSVSCQCMWKLIRFEPIVHVNMFRCHC
ncbi:hypothetical protein DAI22_12g141400 [Oryza sativa Japonica Group]|nr:hypothetical protein DAI22_12g141400 [Oryza sativa Japonica Group]